MTVSGRSYRALGVASRDDRRSARDLAMGGAHASGAVSAAAPELSPPDICVFGTAICSTARLLPSLYRLAVGFAIAVVVGIVVGIALGILRGARSLDPAGARISALHPAVAILPAALLLLGPTDKMRIFVIAFGSVFPILLAAIDGARRVEPMLLDVARVERPIRGATARSRRAAGGAASIFCRRPHRAQHRARDDGDLRTDRRR